MADSSMGLHEQSGTLRGETIDRHRAIVSLMEELEAVDWYDQRVDASADPELAAVLAHNPDEEKEHAAMTLEWLRRRDPVLDQQLRTYLFTSGPIVGVEADAMSRGEAAADGETPSDGDDREAGAADEPGADGSLGIGGLK